jgi:membrane associated rhomboid family serine protease
MDFWVVLVPQSAAEQAREQLGRYERENQGWPPREARVSANSDGVFLGMSYAALLVVGFLAAQRQLFGVDWGALGCSRAARVAAGEPWLCVTALTLHADLVHLAGNLVFGLLFGTLLCWSVGSGIAALTFVFTGALGNLVNAWLQPATHVSIGASAAGFGLLGLGGAWHDPSDVGKEAHKLTEILETTDVIAHFTGFGAGLACGAALGWKRRIRGLPGRVELVLGGSALGIVLVSWWLALARG